MIEIEGLTKRFGDTQAVAGINLSVGEGEVLGLLGPNGAGKSTSMKMVAGFLSPSAGSVRICGHDIETETIAAQACLGYLPEGAPAYGDMTPRQFLNFIAGVRGLKKGLARIRIADAVARTELAHVLDQPIETLSKGFKRRVGLAQAILHDPPVLVMDEPTDGLDPNQKHSVRNLIRALSPGKAIIVSTHLLEEVEALCSRVVIIDRGHIVADGTPAALMARSRYHNSVTLTVAKDKAREAAAKLKSLTGVLAIEETSRSNSKARLTVFARSGAQITGLVSQAATDGGWNMTELYTEPGRLDEVFRAITTHDALPS